MLLRRYHNRLEDNKSNAKDEKVEQKSVKKKETTKKESGDN